MRRSAALMLVALAVGMCGCEPTPERVKAASKVADFALKTSLDAQIRAALKDRYTERFVVDESSFEMGLNMYQFKAHPRRTPSLTFHGDFDERQAAPQRLRSDSYVNEAFSHAAVEHFASIIDPALHRSVGASVYSRYAHPSGQSLIGFDQYLAARPPKSTIRMNRYFFHVPMSPKDPAVAEIRRSFEALRRKYGNEFSLYVGFWDPTFLEGRDPAELSFGFEAKTLDDADDLITEMSHMKKRFFVKLTSGSETPLEDQAVFDLIQPVTPGPNDMTEL